MPEFDFDSLNSVKEENKPIIISQTYDSIITKDIHEGKEYITHYNRNDSCMNCGKEIYGSGESGGCVICDKVLTETELKLFLELEKKTLKPSDIKDKIKKSADAFENSIATMKHDPLNPPEIKKPEKPQPKITKTTKDNNQIIILLWGYDGTSKSEQILKFKPAPIVIDLENKLKPLALKLNFPLENIINASEYNELYQIHGPNTLKGIRDTLTQIRDKIKKGINVSAIALDGITDIRPYAVSEWLDDNPSRKNPATAGDWADINDKVREICFQMINIGRAEGISVFLTAQVGGVYEKNVRVKEVPDCKDWIWHNVDHKFKCYTENQKFYAFCEKSYLDPFWTIDLTDFAHTNKPSLMNILQDPKLLEKYKKEYMDSKQQILDF